MGSLHLDKVYIDSNYFRGTLAEQMCELIFASNVL
jgi:hypothetical protein